MSYDEDIDGITSDVFMRKVFEENITTNPSQSVFFAADETNKPIVSYNSHALIYTFIMLRYAFSLSQQLLPHNQNCVATLYAHFRVQFEIHRTK